MWIQDKIEITGQETSRVWKDCLHLHADNFSYKSIMNDANRIWIKLEKNARDLGICVYPYKVLSLNKEKIIMANELTIRDMINSIKDADRSCIKKSDGTLTSDQAKLEKLEQLESFRHKVMGIVELADKVYSRPGGRGINSV
jgi:hypothetical protein